MGRRRKQGLLDVLIRLPWWMGAVGVVTVLAIRPIVLARISGHAEMLKPVIPQFSFLFYLVAFLFAVGALASFVRQSRTGKKLDRQSGLASLRNLGWREFEHVIQEVFRRQGYLSVESPSGPDGGYDIALRKDGKRYLVQCKHWKSRQVGVAPVRELWGVIAASKANGGFFVTSGSFTPDAEAFARDINLELIDGVKLERLLAKVSSTPVTTSERTEPKVTASRSCPKCGGEMVRRVAKNGANVGKEFWGCVAYPRCWGAG